MLGLRKGSRSHNLKFLEGSYLRDYIGEYYREILGV